MGVRLPHAVSRLVKGVRTALLPVAVSACGGESAWEIPAVACEFGGQDSYAVSDSSGVTVVDNLCPQLDYGWDIDPSPELEIGGSDVVPGAQFRAAFMTWATRLSDGRYVVIERSSDEIRYFSASGDHLRTVGGQGSGPGEFNFLVQPLLLLPEDTLVAFDLLLRRGTLFDPEGEVVSTLPVQGPGITGELLPLAYLADGSFLVRTSVSPSSLHRVEGVYPWTWSVWRAGADGGPPDKALGFEGELEFASYGNGMYVVQLPFSYPPNVAWWQDGVVVVDRTAFEFRRYDLTGAVALVVGREFIARPVTDRQLADRRESFLNGMRRRYEDAVIPAVMRMYERPEIPNTHAVIDATVVDRMGNLWVGLSEAQPGTNHLWRLNGMSRIWSVFGPDGVWITDVRMPEGLLVTDIGDDYVLGVWEGELGVPYIREYALTKN